MARKTQAERLAIADNWERCQVLQVMLTHAGEELAAKDKDLCIGVLTRMLLLLEGGIIANARRQDSAKAKGATPE